MEIIVVQAGMEPVSLHLCMCMYIVQICIPKFVFSMFVAQMIHEDGGSRSKGSPAGMTIDNSLL